jgi:SAM-dependent methyltransferase
MDKLKNKVKNYFDADSIEYLKYKYSEKSQSYMALRKDKAIEFQKKYLVSSFTEETRILDAGCGPGILLDFLSKYKIDYVGLDISIEMIQLARQQVAKLPLIMRRHFLRGDVEKLPFQSNSFDAVVSFGVIEYLDGDNKLLTEIFRVLKPEGYLLISVTNRYSYNLLFDGIIEYLRKKRFASSFLNYMKQRLTLGQFKQRDFTIRKHTPKRFINELRQNNFKVIDTIFFGLNILPYPLNLICSEKLNYFANIVYNRITQKKSIALGEGYLVLCKSNKSKIANN